jgi:hypothetical protein
MCHLTVRTSDYMFKRRIFTMDPDYFPPARMREIIDYLHKHDQRYGMSFIYTNGVTHAMT